MHITYDIISLIFISQCDYTIVMDDLVDNNARRDETDKGAQSGTTEFLHRSVANELQHRVLEGQLLGGTKLPALRHMAEEFNVSTMTIRRALQTLEAEGHVYHMPGVGVFVRSDGPAVGEIGQKMLAFAATDLSSAFEMYIARGIEKACQEYDWAIQIFDAQLNTPLERRNISRIPNSGSMGAVILPTCSPENIDVLLKLQSSGYPFVLVDRTIPGLNTDLVESDHEHGAYQAVQYLIRNGHKRVLLLTPPPFLLSVAARIRGYERAMHDAGIELSEDSKVWTDPELQTVGVVENRRWLEGYTAILPVLKREQPPLAVFAVEDYICWGVYEACRELNLRIPEDVSVICFDNSDITMTMLPPTTVIAQQTDEIGRIAVQLLDARVRSDPQKDKLKKTYTHTVIDTELIERQSVASLNQVDSGIKVPSHLNQPVESTDTGKEFS